MFDANMRHLPKGMKFFADVWGVKADTILHKAGVRKGDVILCEMLDKDTENPRVKVTLPHTYRQVDSDSEGLFAYWMVYLCHLDENTGEVIDFMYNKDKERSEKLLEQLNG